MSRRTRSIALVSAMIAIAGTGSLFYFNSSEGDRPSSLKIEKVRIGTFLTALDYSPYFIAKEKGWFEDALKGSGIQVVYTDPFQSLPPVNEAFATSRVDVVMTADVPAIVGRAAGIDIQVAWLSCTLNSEVVLQPALEATSIADLKGKKVAVLFGTGPHYGLLRHAEVSGLSRRDFTFVDMTPPDAKAAFETGSVAAWAIFPPFIEQEVTAKKGRILPGYKSPVQIVAAVRGRWADEHPEAMSAILKALERAKEWIRQNPEEAQLMMSRKLDLPLEVVKLSWTKLDWEAGLDSSVIEDVRAKADFLKEEGFIKNAVDVEGGFIRKPGQKPADVGATKKAA